jgi:hypothetical protein
MQPKAQAVGCRVVGAQVSFDLNDEPGEEFAALGGRGFSSEDQGQRGAGRGRRRRARETAGEGTSFVARALFLLLPICIGSGEPALSEVEGSGIR